MRKAFEGLQGDDVNDEIEYSANSVENDSGVYRLDFRNMTVEKVELERVSPNRQGWRARLANVERLLHDAEHYSLGDERKASRLRSQALVEVRSMLDGDNEAKP